MRGEMQSMGIGLQDRLEKVKDEMKGEINTVWAEVNKLKKNVEGVRIAMEANKKEMANEIKTAVQEIDKLGKGLEKVKEGQDQIKGEMKKNTVAIGQLKKEQGGIKEGLKAVTVECEKRHQDMTERVEKLGQEVKAETQKGLEAVMVECERRHQEIIMEMERKAEEKTKELGKRIEKHEGETEEQFRITRE